MTNTVAKIRRENKIFEIMIDLDIALKIKKGESEDIASALLANDIFYDAQKGLKASQEDLEKAFQTTDIFQAAEQIIKKGNIELPQEYRDAEQEAKRKQVIEWYVRNAVDSKSGRPFTPDMISSALNQAGVNIDKKPVEQQISTITPEISKIIPLKIETKKLIITIPAIYTGKIYGMLNDYKEKEDWLSNGDLKVTINIPIGLQSDFYDKLNAVTHGAALSEEVKTE